MMLRRLAVIAAIAVCTSGCTLGNWNSIYREFSTSSGDSQLVDVKQRSILVQADKEGRKMVCAEPSPDAMSVYASAFVAKAEATNQSGAATEGTRGSLEGSTNESGVLQLRTASIQLLRDGYYRACEAYLSGAIDKETYDTLIRRLNNQAIAYLAIETIANAPGPAHADVSVQDLDQLQKDLTAHRQKKDELGKKLEAAQKELAQAGTDEAKAAAPKKTIGDVTPQIAAEDTEIKKLEKKLTDGAKAVAASPPHAGGASGPEAALLLAKSVLEADYTPQNCYAHLRLSDAAKGAMNKDSVANVTDYCRRILGARARDADTDAGLRAAYAEQSLTAAHWFRTNCAHPSDDAKVRETCRKAAEEIIKSGKWQFGSAAATANTSDQTGTR